MNAKDWFGVVVRTVGLLVFTWGAWYAGTAAAMRMGITEPRLGPFAGLKDYENMYLAYGVTGMLYGLYLIRGAPFLFEFAYPEVPQEDGPGSKAETKDQVPKST